MKFLFQILEKLFRHRAPVVDLEIHMLRTTVDYHTPIVDIWQKPTLQIKWFYTQQDYGIVMDYIVQQLETTRFDYLRYVAGLWYGIGQVSSQYAWLDQPERYSLPFTEFLKLVDFKIKQFKTPYGKIDNQYTTIYISSRHTLYELYPEISNAKLEKVIQFMDVNRIEF